MNSITGKASKKKLTILVITALCIAVVCLLLYIINFRKDIDDKMFYLTHEYFGGKYSGYQFGDFLLYGLTYTFELGVSFLNTVLEILWIGLPIFVIVSLLKMPKSKIAVSDGLITGNESFGRGVNIPLEKVSSVRTGAFDSVIITTGSKKYKFWLLDNKEKIVSCISKQIGKKTVKTTNDVAVPEELKKYKELLDTGVITQEEFDAKKKQLLGL